MIPVLHDLLIVLLVGLRPLVWDGDPAAPANLIYLSFVVMAAFVAAAECWTSGTMRWTWRSAATAALVAFLLPACWQAPIPPEGRAYGIQLIITAVEAWYLLQVLPGRAGLVTASLLGGLAVEVLVGLGQPAFVLPAMALANQGGSLSPVMGDVSSADIAERIANGGVFATFTLSNTFGAWLLLALPVAWAAAQQTALPAGRRAVAWLLLVLGLWVFLSTGSKGSWLVALAVLGAAWAIPRRAWWTLPVAAAAGWAAFQVPAVARGLSASATVRWEYWQGALRLVAEAPWTGAGWGAFAQRSAQVMPITAEPTRLVHNGLLEIAVAAGLVVALAAALWGILLVWPRSAVPEPTAPEPVKSASPGQILGVSIFALVYGTLLGGLDGNLGWWPGGPGLGMLPWAACLGAVLGLVVILLRRIQPPAPALLRLALVAFLLHALVDVDLMSMACIGTLAVVAVLAGGGGNLVRLPWRGLPLAVVLTVACLGIAWGVQATRQRDGTETQPLVSLALQGGETGRDALGILAGGLPVRPGDEQAVIIGGITRAMAQVGDDHTARLRLVSLLPPGPERLREFDALLPLLPHHVGLAMQRADQLVRLGRREEGLAEARRGAAMAPANLPLRARVADLLTAAAQADPLRAPGWLRERAEVLAESERLKPIVNPRNR